MEYLVLNANLVLGFYLKLYCGKSECCNAPINVNPVGEGECGQGVGI